MYGHTDSSLPAGLIPGAVYCSARHIPPSALKAKKAAESRLERPRDVTLDDVIAAEEALERTDPAEAKRRERISKAYHDGDFDLGVVMDEQGVSERKARKILASEAYWRDLRENNPAEFAFHEALDWWKANAKRLLKAGEISYGAIMASATPLHTTDMPPAFWPRIQQWVRENVPLSTGQLAAYEQGYYQRQRAHALALFSWFTPQRRAEEWCAHYHKEQHPKWWHNSAGGDAKAWAIRRAELQRMIAADNAGSFQ